jgi:hypothetical protein
MRRWRRRRCRQTVTVQPEKGAPLPLPEKGAPLPLPEKEAMY